jgi:predicted nucleic acid-binding protein
MSIFVDTSALFAILDADDLSHAAAKKIWARLLAGNERLVSTNYVLVETFALAQRRLGMEAVNALVQDIVPVLQIEWIDSPQHSAALNKLLSVAHRQLSLVDWVSFVTMQRLELKTAFAFDADFVERGFECIPAES